MILKKIFIVRKFVVASVLISAAAVFAEGVFNSNLDKSDIQKISLGETVIKNTGSYKKMCVESDNAGVKSVKKIVSNLKPAYFAEVIKAYPYEGNENLPDEFASLVMDIPSYAGIPYYSERAEAWYDLYSSAEIKSSEKNGGTETVLADFEMKPFGLVNMKIISEKGADYYLYESTNLSTLRYYDKFDCVSEENMKSLIVIFRDGDRWILYGIGAVKAPSVFFLRERIDTSFMNRIKTFCSYFFAKMENSQS
jgi:hypothetical protein